MVPWTEPIYVKADRRCPAIKSEQAVKDFKDNFKCIKIITKNSSFYTS